MNNISDQELLALQAHVEVEASRWLRLKRRILIRAVAILGLILCRALMLKLFPQIYTPIIFGTQGIESAELESLVYTRMLVVAVLAGVYLYALLTNSYLRSVSVVALIVPIALIWADLQVFLISSFPEFTAVASISFGLRLVTIYLLALNYIDIRR
jgi:hypothetical protein